MDIMEAIESIGFDCVGSCSTEGLEVREEVREMCASGRCQVYGKSWACPPNCGDLPYFDAFIHDKATCYVVQTVGEMEDSFDFEAMMDAEHLQKERVFELHKLLQEVAPEARILSSGTCTLCKPCAFPDEPCRFPDRAMVSMEAAGLVVSDVCTLAGIPYNHGNLTIAYSSCVLI